MKVLIVTVCLLYSSVCFASGFFGGGGSGKGSSSGIFPYIGVGTTSPNTNNKIEVKDGHIVTTQTTVPTTSSCGTSAVVVGTDQAGSVTITGVAVTACTVTFNMAWNTVYGCQITSSASMTTPPYVSALSNSAFTVMTVATTNPLFYYRCDGK